MQTTKLIPELVTFTGRNCFAVTLYWPQEIADVTINFVFSNS